MSKKPWFLYDGEDPEEFPESNRSQYITNEFYSIEGGILKEIVVDGVSYKLSVMESHDSYMIDEESPSQGKYVMVKRGKYGITKISIGNIVKQTHLFDVPEQIPIKEEP
mgnify:CR=1 FL=1